MTVKRGLRWVIAAVLALAILAGIFLFALHLYGAHRLARAHSRFARELMPSVPANACTWTRTDPRNGAYWYFAAAARLSSATPGLADVMAIVRHPPGAWSPSEVERVVSVLAGQQKSLDFAHEGASRPVCSFDPMVANEMGPSLVRFSTLLLADIGLELRRGRQERAAGATETLEALGAGLERQPSLLYELLGTAVMIKYLRAVDWLVESDSVSAETLKRLRMGLPGRGVPEALAPALAAEESLALGWSKDPHFRRGLYAFCFADRDAAVMVEGYGDVLSWTRQTYRQATRAVATQVQKHQNAGEIVWSMLVPNLLGSMAKCQAVTASRQLAAVALDLRMYAAAQGEFPSHLPAAEAALVDPLAGAHPVYTKTDRGARISNPVAAAEYRALDPRANASVPPFAWTLPEPARRPPA
jgi:hypothetical protein